MKYKKYLLGVMMLGTMLAVTILSGCESGKTDKTENTETVSQDNLVTIEEIPCRYAQGISAFYLSIIVSVVSDSSEVSTSFSLVTSAKNALSSSSLSKVARYI